MDIIENDDRVNRQGDTMLKVETITLNVLF